MPFFGRKQREKDEAVERKIAEINRPAIKASQEATAKLKRLNTAIKREDIVFNLYYATHTREAQK